MPLYYFDASAVVKAYVEEEGTFWVKALIEDEATPIVISPLSGAEVVAALARKARLNEIRRPKRDEAVESFRSDYRHRFIQASLDARTIERAMGLLLEHPLRAADAIQLATALLLPSPDPLLAPLSFVSSDDKLLAVAARLGLATENPTRHA